jgi:hypothetical protein
LSIEGACRGSAKLRQLPTANGDALFALPLLDAVLDRGFAPQTCAMDKGYDSRAIHDGCFL